LKLLEVKEPVGTTTAGQKILFPKANDFPAGEERLAIFRVRATGTGPQTLQVEAFTNSMGPARAIKQAETITILPASPAATTRSDTHPARRPVVRATFKAAS
jgi:hypothetical protein